MTKLLPCPFCGSDEIDLDCTDGHGRDFEYEVRCLGECGAMIVHPDKSRAINLWNSRSE